MSILTWLKVFLSFQDCLVVTCSSCSISSLQKDWIGRRHVPFFEVKSTNGIVIQGHIGRADAISRVIGVTVCEEISKQEMSQGGERHTWQDEIVHDAESGGQFQKRRHDSSHLYTAVLQRSLPLLSYDIILRRMHASSVPSPLMHLGLYFPTHT